MSYSESTAQRDTTCDSCNAEIPKGMSTVVDNVTNRLYCGVECWEDDCLPDEEEA